MLIALWIVNALLALGFLGAGLMKLLRDRDALVASGMAWAGDFQPGAIKAIGAAEVLGALGLILPLATGILPILSPVAATALAVLMAGAVVVHLRRRESATPSMVLAVLAVASAVIGFIALG